MKQDVNDHIIHSMFCERYDLKEQSTAFRESCAIVELSLYDGSPAPPHLSTTVEAIWTESDAYFRFRGAFSSLRIAPEDCEIDKSSGKTPGLWELSDVFELFMGPEVERLGRYREFQVSPDSRWIDISIELRDNTRRTDFSWKSGMHAQSVLDYDERVWTALFQIPFTAFESHPRREVRWSCNFYRISGPPEDRAYLAWSPVQEINFHKPLCFGEIIFVTK